MSTAVDPATSVTPEIVAAGAEAIAQAFGLGDQVLPSNDWPIDDGDTALVATLDDASMLVLAVNDEVAARLNSDTSRLTNGFAAALAAMVEAGAGDGATQIVEVGQADVVPSVVSEIHDGKQLCALFGVAVPTPGADDLDDDIAGSDGEAPGGAGAAPMYEPAALAGADQPMGAFSAGPLTLLEDVEMDVTVELGRTTMPIRELLALQPGMVVEIDRAAGAPIDVLVNGRRIACGEVVVIDEEFGIRITDIVDSRARV